MAETKTTQTLEIPTRKKRRRYILPLVGLGVAAVAAYAFLGGPSDLAYNFIVAEKGDLTQEVNVTGKVVAAESVELSFESSGKVTAVYVDVGDSVSAGDILIQLDQSELRAQLAASLADLASERAQLARYVAVQDQEEAVLAELNVGTRIEEIQIAETDVSNAEKALEDELENLDAVMVQADTDLENDYKGVTDILSDVLTKAENVVHNQLDDFFKDSGSTEELSFLVHSPSIESQSKWGKTDANQALENLNDIANGTLRESSFDEKDQVLNEALDALFTINDLLVVLDDALEDNRTLNDSTLSSYGTTLNSARTSIDSAISSVNIKQQNISTQLASNQSNISVAEAAVNSAQNALFAAQDKLALARAGAPPEQIAAQEAIVNQAKANIQVQNARISRASSGVSLDQAKLNKTVLRSPIDGTVTLQEAKVGEIIGSSTITTSVISELLFQVEANVPEVDIANILEGNMAKLSLDAYGRRTKFQTRVIKIDPAETVIEGVSTYKVTLEFLEDDDRIKSGMTANIDILTAEQKDVISVQKRTITTKDGEEYLKVIRGDEIVEVPVVTGLSGKDGYVEILDGLEEGDMVVTFINE